MLTIHKIVKGTAFVLVLGSVTVAIAGEEALRVPVQSPSATIRIQSARFFRNNSLVALAGAVAKQETLVGFVELVSLSTGGSTKFRANINFPVIEFLPSLSSLIIAEFRSLQVHPIKDN